MICTESPRSRMGSLGLALTLIVLIGHAHSEPQAQTAQPGSTPDFSGFWILDRNLTLNYRPPRPSPTGMPRGWMALKGYTTNGNEPPPVRPEVLETIAGHQEAETHGLVMDEGTAKCLAPTNFDMMTWGDPLDIVQRTDEVAIIPEKERSLPRRIYVGGQLPATLERSPIGHSVGHWEGDTLVVDTIGFDPDGYLFFGEWVPHSADLHVSERIHLEDGGAKLIFQWTIDDPKVFTKPWRLNIKYNRAPVTTEAVEAVCDVDQRGDKFGK